ncbi:MAG: hypothetical protein ACO1SV_08575 [Fimbriimonas sp.]
MSPEEATQGAQSILDKRPNDSEIRVHVDNPNDCRATIQAFRKLGCRVKVEQDGARLVVKRTLV